MRNTSVVQHLQGSVVPHESRTLAIHYPLEVVEYLQKDISALAYMLSWVLLVYVVVAWVMLLYVVAAGAILLAVAAWVMVLYVVVAWVVLLYAVVAWVVWGGGLVRDGHKFAALSQTTAAVLGTFCCVTQTASFDPD